MKKLKRRKVYARFKDNIQPADLAEMVLYSSKYNNFSLCVVDVFTKYAQFKPLQNKNVKTFLNALIKIGNVSNREPNNLWVDQGR